MTEEELKAEAKKIGCFVGRKPCYQCSCYQPYPNEMHRNKNGTWKCIDRYKPIKFKRKHTHQPMTRCVKK